MPIRGNASGRSSRTSPGTGSGRGNRATARTVFIFSGQSNMSAYSQSIILKNSGTVNTGFGGSPTTPDFVPGYAKTAANEWSGASPASIDTNIQYTYPGLATHPCLYNQAVNITTYYDAWGAYVGSTPDPSTGVVADSSGYGLEMTFLAKHLVAYPSIPLAALKNSMGGSSLGEWCPAHTGANATGTDGYLWTSLSVMLSQATARLNASGQAWRWGGFIWMQGESGAHSGNPDDSAYLSGCRAFFAAVRALTRSDLPVIVGRIGDNWGWTASGSGDTTLANPYLRSYGVPYAAIDYSITSSALTVTQPLRDSYVTSAAARRATQVTLGGDSNCNWFNNDGYPCRPPYLPGCESANNDSTGYHWGSPGNLAAGERAFSAFQAARN